MSVIVREVWVGSPVRSKISRASGPDSWQQRLTRTGRVGKDAEADLDPHSHLFLRRHLGQVHKFPALEQREIRRFTGFIDETG